VDTWHLEVSRITGGDWCVTVRLRDGHDRSELWDRGWSRSYGEVCELVALGVDVGSTFMRHGPGYCQSPFSPTWRLLDPGHT
jgi:hypothetical protein